MLFVAWIFMRSPEAGVVFDPLHHGRRPSFAARLIWQMTSKLRGFQIQTWILDFTGVAHSMKMRRTYQKFDETLFTAM